MRDLNVPIWPRALAPEQIGWGLARPVLVGPQPISGRPQSVQASSAAWRVSLTNVALYNDRDTVRLFRALFFGTLAQGLPVYLPLYDWWRNPRARGGLYPLPTGIDAAATVFAASPALARATSLVVTGTLFPAAGEFIGIGGERAHVVVSATASAPSPGLTTLQIQPALRNAVLSGDAIETIDPLCRMVVDPKAVETVTTLSRGLRGRVTLDFYEANWT